MDYKEQIAEAQENYDNFIDELLANLQLEEAEFTKILTKAPQIIRSYSMALQSGITASAGKQRAEFSFIADKLMASNAAILSAVVNYRTRRVLTSSDALE
jgi:hypothetical protein